MSSVLGNAFRQFWHTMTSYDRHSTLDSPYRSGRHVPLNQQGLGVLTSVASGTESRTEYSSSYADDAARRADGDHSFSSHSTPISLSLTHSHRPYSPGLRSLDARRTSSTDRYERTKPTSEIPMQAFENGLPPPPPVSHAWSRIDKWAEEHYPELYDQLCEGCTINDLNELEHQLDCSLPPDVRESLQIHDGQERGGTPTGIIFGSMLLDCEEMVQEWEQWRLVNQQYMLERNNMPKPPALAPEASSSKPGSSSKPRGVLGAHTNWRQDLLGRQDSVPLNAVQKAYAHPAWIPLARDWGGNNLAIDLAPGPSGTWGQVILFGRDYDTKYAVARSWAAFLAIVADDLNSGKWFIDDDTMELKLREFKSDRVEPSYFDILRWRMDQKYGRQYPQKRRSVITSNLSASVPASATSTASISPYSSPIDGPAESRGRSLHRLNANSPIASPNRLGYGKSSPLARVNEEAGPAGPSDAKNSSLLDANGTPAKLVDAPTPNHSDDDIATPGLNPLLNGTSASDKGKEPDDTVITPINLRSEQLEDVMKTIEL